MRRLLLTAGLLLLAVPAARAQSFTTCPPIPEPPLPPSAWLFGVELSVLFPHLRNHTDPAKFAVPGDIPATSPLNAGFPLPTTGLNAAFSPRLFLGYRLPYACGEVGIAYRAVASSGSTYLTDFAGGPGRVKTRLDQHIIDFVYASDEPGLLPNGTLRWEIGGRYASSFWDTDTGTRSTSNHVRAGGLFGALQVTASIADGLELYGRGESSALLGGVAEESRAIGPQFTDTYYRSTVASVVTLEAKAGVRWSPAWLPDSMFAAGYQVGQWWNFVDEGANSDLRTRGFFVNWTVNY